MRFIVAKYRYKNAFLCKLNDGDFVGAYAWHLDGLLYTNNDDRRSLEWWMETGRDTDDQEMAHKIQSGELKPFWVGENSIIHVYALRAINTIKKYWEYSNK